MTVSDDDQYVWIPEVGKREDPCRGTQTYSSNFNPNVDPLMGRSEFQEFITPLIRRKFVLDRGTHGIGSATCFLLQKFEKAVGSIEESTERFTFCCASVKRCCQRRARSGELRVTYELLRKREKRVFSTAHAAENAGGLPPVAGAATYQLLHEREKGVVSRAYAVENARQLTSCCASVKTRHQERARGGESRTTYPLLREHGKRVWHTWSGESRKPYSLSRERENASSAARAQCRKQEQLTFCCTSMKKRVVSGGRVAENAGQGGLPPVAQRRTRGGERRAGWFTSCCASMKTRRQRHARAGRVPENAGRLTSCCASVKNTSGAHAVEKQGDLRTVARASSAARARWRKQGGLQTVAQTRDWCRGVSGAHAVENAERLTFYYTSVKGGVSRALACSGERRATYFLLHEHEKAESAGRVQWRTQGDLRTVGRMHGGENRGTYNLLCEREKQVVSGAHAVENAGRLTPCCTRVKRGRQLHARRERRAAYQLLCEGEKRVVRSARTEENRATYRLLRERERRVVRGARTEEKAGRLTHCCTSVKRRRQQGAGARMEEKAGRLTSCCASVKRVSSAARTGWRSRATYELLREREKHVVSGAHKVEKQGDLRAVAQARVVSGARKAEKQGDLRTVAQRSKTRCQQRTRGGEAGRLTSCCASVKRASSAARTGWRSRATYELLREREKGVISGVHRRRAQGGEAGRLTSCCASVKTRRQGRTHGGESRATYELLRKREKGVVSGAHRDGERRVTYGLSREREKGGVSRARTGWRTQGDLQAVRRAQGGEAGQLTSCCTSVKNMSSAGRTQWRKQGDLSTYELLCEREKGGGAHMEEKAGRLTSCCASMKRASSAARTGWRSRTTYELLRKREKHVVSSACSGESRATYELSREREKHVVSRVHAVEKAGRLTLCCASVKNTSSAGCVQRRKQGDLRPVARASKTRRQQGACSGESRATYALLRERQKHVVSRARHQQSAYSGECRAAYPLLSEHKKSIVSTRVKNAGRLTICCASVKGRSEQGACGGETRTTYPLLCGVSRARPVEKQGDLPAVHEREKGDLLREGEKRVVRSARTEEKTGQLTVYCASVKDESSAARAGWRSRVTYPLLYEGEKASSVGHTRRRTQGGLPPVTRA
ncbi:hypothetical protein C8J57DRAFT_1233400 [Mycena rebaudengoi]|nr:hypothetical protein C8J57DRAFT_1233400 [Mycena rebaudengoi]